jgi:hypothetical protein
MKRFLILTGLLFMLTPVICLGDEGGKALTGKAKTEIPLNSPDLKVFPNPVQNKWFAIELSNDKIIEIKISNIAGSSIYFKTLPIPAEKYQVFTDNIANGIYLLRITSANHFSKTVKLLISNR